MPAPCVCALCAPFACPAPLRSSAATPEEEEEEEEGGKGGELSLSRNGWAIELSKFNSMRVPLLCAYGKRVLDELLVFSFFLFRSLRSLMFFTRGPRDTEWVGGSPTALCSHNEADARKRERERGSPQNSLPHRTAELGWREAERGARALGKALSAPKGHGPRTHDVPPSTLWTTPGALAMAKACQTPTMF